MVSVAVGQNAHAPQSAAASLSTLPEADLLVYLNPQKIFNEAAPKVIPPKELEEMRASFFDLKRAAGVDPAALDYFVLAVRFRKPAADLSFVPPDVLAVAGGDFSSETLMTMARVALGDKVRDEQYGARTIAIAKIDEVAAMTEMNPMLKSFTELGIINLTPTSIAVGNVAYLKAAADAVDGNGRISQNAIQSLLRDPNSLLASSGSPIGSFAKSFGLLGTEGNPREPRCDTRFGDFYAGVTLVGTRLNLRGAMNADNPDTAKIINGLLNGLIDTAINTIPDPDAKNAFKAIKLSPRESEVVVEGDLPAKTLVDFLTPSKKEEATAPTPPKKRRVTVRKKRTIKH